jgi:sugar phosphate isomerase/epimerase
MQIGYVTNCLGQTTIQEAVKVAAEVGFDCLEVGPSVDRDREAFRSVQKDGPVFIHSFIYGRNFLTHHAGDRQAYRAETYRLLDLAIDVGVPQITTATGVDPNLSLDGNISAALDFWAPLLDQALDADIRIALEFCPTAGNFALGPYAWRRLLAATNDWPNFGLNYDPSHLLWQFIDPYPPVSEFSEQIFSVHLKDTYIWHDRLAEHGFLTPYANEEEMAHGMRESRAVWWEYRVPGEGELDLIRFLRLLYSIGYQGALLVELEDKRYIGSHTAVLEGLRVGLNNIRQAIQTVQGELQTE